MESIHYNHQLIKDLQNQLKQVGFSLNEDGIFGDKTKQALMSFQFDEGLKVDGLLGANTLERLLLRVGVGEEEVYANSRNIKSDTKFFIWVNSEKHKVNIFKGKTYQWKLVKNYLATLGKEETPTIKGHFKVGAKGVGYGGSHYGFKVKWYTQIKNNYLFHSIPYNLDGSVFDGRLGLNLSDGCVRLKEEHAKYIYDNIPYRTKILIT